MLIASVLPFQIDGFLIEFVGCGDHSGVGLIGSLSDDQIDKFSSHVHIGQFQSTASDDATPAGTGGADGGLARAGEGGESAAVVFLQSLAVGKYRERQLCQIHSVAVLSLSDDNPIIVDDYVGKRTGGIAVLRRG